MNVNIVQREQLIVERNSHKCFVFEAGCIHGNDARTDKKSSIKVSIHKRGNLVWQTQSCIVLFVNSAINVRRSLR